MKVEWDTVLSVGIALLIIGVLLIVFKGPLMRLGKHIHGHHESGEVEPAKEGGE